MKARNIALILALPTGVDHGVAIAVVRTGSKKERVGYVAIERRAQDELLGIHFKVGGAFPFLGFPIGELHNMDITLGDLWGEKKMGELLGLVHDAATVEMKFQVLEKWLVLAADCPLQHRP